MKTQTKAPESKTIQMIPILKVCPHPDNPRKDLGDLTELADSIRENGILQNLTIVPYVGEETGKEIEGLYRCVIGHRRLAAAKLAGLESVPCVVVQMSLPDQVKTMLMENMQRTDLTFTEQADGFQMMLDLGADLDEIARQSGFSKVTIRHRLQLRELDRQKLEQRLSQGATLMDLIKLEEIENLKARNKVLKTIGTYNFNYELRKALEDQAGKKNKPRWIALMDTFAQKLSREDCKLKEWRYGGYFNYSQDPDQFRVPSDAGTATYGYFAAATMIELKKDLGKMSGEDGGDPEETALRELIRKTEEELEESSKRAHRLRLEFIKNANLRQKDVRHVTNYLLAVLGDRELRSGYSMPNDSTVNELFDIPSDLGYSESRKLRDAAFPALLAKDQEKALLYMAYAAAGDSEHEDYYVDDWRRRYPQYKKNKMLDALYDLLETLGYPISDEERLLMSGEHPMFQPGKEETEDIDDEDDEDDEDDDEDLEEEEE